MVRVTSVSEIVSDDVMYVEYAGKSTDTKPTEYGKIFVFVNGERIQKSIKICTGSVFIEVDTGDVYMFDEESSTWKKVGDDE